MRVSGRMLGGALLAAALGLLPSPPGSAEAPIRIGASVSQTGTYGLLGQNQLRGYRLCVKLVNARGGVLGRSLELRVEDDRSDVATAVRIYERLITGDRVDAVLGPYSSPITEAVADVAEKHRMPMLAPGAVARSIYTKGRKFVFMVSSPGEIYHEGLIDMAARRGLRTVAILHQDSLFTRATAEGAVELAKKRGLVVTGVESYPPGTGDFTSIVTRVRAASPDVLLAATYFDDAVAIAKTLRALETSPKMFGVTAGGDLAKFYEALGPTAEFVYGATQWEPDLVGLVRDGQRIPVGRRYPGARELVEAHRREFAGADLSYHTAAGYSGCEVLVEAIRRAGSLGGDRVRAAIAALDLNTAYGGFKVNADGVQVAHTMLVFQWQDGKKVIVWPDELAPGKPRFPTPPWSQRR